MPTIENRLNQHYTLFLSTGKTVQLFVKGTATISDKELILPEIQRLISRGDIRVVKKAEDIPKKEKKSETIETVPKKISNLQ